MLNECMILDCFLLVATVYNNFRSLVKALALVRLLVDELTHKSLICSVYRHSLIMESIWEYVFWSSVENNAIIIKLLDVGDCSQAASSFPVILAEESSSNCCEVVRINVFELGSGMVDVAPRVSVHFSVAHFLLLLLF